MTTLAAMKKQYHSLIREAHYMAFVQVVRANKKISLENVYKFARELGLSNINVVDIFTGDPKAPAGWPKSSSTRTKSGTERGRRTKRGKKATARTKTGRKRPTKAPPNLELHILAILKNSKDWMSQNDIRAKIKNATEHHIRRALNKLIEQGKVEYKGHARWTQYKYKRK